MDTKGSWVAKSRAQGARRELLAELDRTIRMMTGQSVLLSQSVAARAGINSTDLECLDLIHTRGTASAGELAAATGLTSGAITSVIDRLDRAGYVRREADPVDRRKVLLRLVPESTEKIAAIYVPLQQEMNLLWDQYDDEQIALVIDFLSRSCKAVEKHLMALQERPRRRKPRT